MPTQRMRRILLLITDLEIGGTPTVVRELAIRLNSPEVHVEVACLAKWGPVAEQIREAGVEVNALGASGVRDFPVIVWRFVKLMREHRIDTVFSFLVHANVVAAIGSLFVRDVRFIQSIQTTQPNPRWHWRLQGIAQEMAERIVVPSESAGRVAQEWSVIPGERIVVIPNAVSDAGPCITGYQPVPHGLEARDTVRVGFLGRLDAVKRVTDLVEAMTHLDGRYELHIFGEGSERRENRIHDSASRSGRSRDVARRNR